MTEADNNPAQPETPGTPEQPPAPQGDTPPPAPEQQAQSLREELAKARSRNKLLVVVAVILGTVFVLVAGAGYVFYKRVSDAKDTFVQAFSTLPAPQAGYQPENRLPGQGGYSSTAMPVSSLGLFSGGLQQDTPDMNVNLAEMQNTVLAMKKYSDRPLVRDFLADLNKLPGAAGAFDKGGGNPMAVIATMRGSKEMTNLIMKYSARPDFMPLVKEFMSDPEMQPLTKMIPQGSLPPGFAPPAQPKVRPVSTRSAPQQEPDYAEEPEDGGEIPFDTSAISGPSGTAPVKTSRPPPPIDRD